jgi:Icc-related predicted phosphoesterase
MLRIACISDTHDLHRQVEIPACDVLVHAGDLTGMGALHKLADFDDWCAELPLDRSRILVCAGNHDFCLEQQPEVAEPMLGSCTYLRDEGVVIEGVKFYASPWQPRFFDWAFNLDRGGEELKQKWALIPDDTQVLITHGPPHGLCDINVEGEHTGCELLLERIRQVRPRLHVCGHIHEAYGSARTEFGTLVVNASVCDLEYAPVNPPVLFEV